MTTDHQGVLLNLYHVQDLDRPMWVVAKTMGEAVKRWQEVVAVENDQTPDDVGEPQGVHFICEGKELCLP